MRTLGRITGLALLVGGHVILPFYINVKLIERGYSLSFAYSPFLSPAGIGILECGTGNPENYPRRAARKVGENPAQDRGGIPLVGNLKKAFR